MKHPRHKAIRLWRKRHPIKVKISISEEVFRYAFNDSKSLMELVNDLCEQVQYAMEGKINGQRIENGN